MGQTNRHSMRKVMKFLLAFTFVATIQAYHLGYYQPYVVYPQFYQTFPNIRIPRPFMEHQIESHQRNVCKNNIGEVVPCYKIFAEKVDQSRIKPVMSNVFKSIEKIQETAKLPVFKRPVNPLFYSISQDNEEHWLVKFCQDFEEKDFEQEQELFGEFVDLWDYEEDLIFRKLTGIDRGVARGGAEGALAPPEFGRSVNPIQTRGADYTPHTTASPSGFKKLSTLLIDEFFDKDVDESLVADLNDICANPSAEDAEANFWNIWHIILEHRGI